MPSDEKISFNRNEWSGAFGDIGTDLPLIAGLILTNRFDVTSILILFGLFQLLTALTYRIPMPVQPLKAMAALVLTQNVAPELLYGGGLAIGLTMLLLTLTGLLQKLSRMIPLTVVRGIQFGLGLSLAQLAVKNYIASEALSGYLLGAFGLILILAFFGNKKYPPAIPVIILGLIYTLFFRNGFPHPLFTIQMTLPRIHLVSMHDLYWGFILLSLPQLPLSLGNSILATEQTIKDLFPEKKVPLGKIGLTYSLMNLFAPFFGGIPTCHGSGGLAGHFAFGGRTGGSVIIYGSFYLILGLFFSATAYDWIRLFPLPLLGVLLFIEAVTMMSLMKESVAVKHDLFIIFTVGLMILTLPYGYLAGMIFGTLIHRWFSFKLGSH
jgi:MFS superfamily sulfate permease-like transporter